MGETFPGEVVADVIEVRFGFSGRVASVGKRRGDRVKRGEVLAALDTKQLQAELERQLAQYEKVRAEFEIFAKHHPNPGDDLTQYGKKVEQAQLDASVKEVELVKMRLDMTSLTCPVNGVVVDDGGNRVGLNVTPASNVYKILDMDSLGFAFEVTTDKVGIFGVEREGVVKAAEREIRGRVMWPVADGRKFRVGVKLAEAVDWVPGMPGEVRIGFE